MDDYLMSICYKFKHQISVSIMNTGVGFNSIFKSATFYH